MMGKETKIRESARRLWEYSGKVEGFDREFWIAAERWVNLEDVYVRDQKNNAIPCWNNITSPIRVLIVEDNPGDAQLTAVALAESKQPKFHITFASTMQMACELLYSDSIIDIVLLDLSLPDIRGEDTVLRMCNVAPGLPIIIMTGLDNIPFAQRMVALGAQDYLVKGDFTYQLLWRAISYAITRMHQTLERETLVRELRDSVNMKNKLLGLLAHDLRNPIGAINGHAEIMEMTGETDLSKQMVKSLRAIQESATYMNGLIEDVLSIALANASEIIVNRKRNDMEAIVRKVADMEAVHSKKKQVRLHIDAKQIWADVDALKIEQVLDNLINNAIKFSKPNDVVTISVINTGDGVRLAVSDHGSGISSETMKNLFKPFIKGKPGTAGEPSNGLGLYICSQIVEAHGGKIHIDTKDGVGTTFAVNLPSTVLH
jgi:signal transduction histidine kinase